MSGVWLGVLLIGGLVAGVLRLGRRSREKRRAGLRAVARAAGWSFAAEDVPQKSLDLAPFPLLARGLDRQASNLMRFSSGGASILVCDYRYDISTGDSSTVNHQTIVRIKSKRLALPSFSLMPRSMFHRISELLGWDSVELEHHPEFSRKYTLRAGGDDESVRRLFAPSIVAYFEQRAETISVQGHGQQLLVFGDMELVDPKDIRAFVDDAQAIARQFMS